MSADQATAVTITRNQQRYLSWSGAVLIYIIVLNLFVEFVEAIVSESFWISILTAVLPVALLDIVRGIEQSVSAFFEKREGTIFKILGYAASSWSWRRERSPIGSTPRLERPTHHEAGCNPVNGRRVYRVVFIERTYWPAASEGDFCLMPGIYVSTAVLEDTGGTRSVDRQEANRA